MSVKTNPHLHEILAVEKSLAETANHVLKDTVKNLSERRALFEGMTKTHQIFDDAKQHLLQAPENKEVQSTVDEQLDYMATEIAKYYDVVLQKESANQTANADIVIDGTTIAKNIPAIVLLGLESKLLSLVAVYNAIPTLDAARSWEPAVGYAKPNVFRVSFPEERFQDATVRSWKEISPATANHPAQLKEIESVDRQGKYTIVSFSAALTSEDKAARISRLHAMLRAVKEARQRANNAEVTAFPGFGKTIFSYING
jgi:hypothetical protein